MAQLDHNTTTAKHPRKAVSDVHLFFSKRTPNFSSRLDVLIFSAISASDVLNDVLNYYLYGIQSSEFRWTDRRTDNGRTICFFRQEVSDLRRFLSNFRLLTFFYVSQKKRGVSLQKSSFTGKEIRVFSKEGGINMTLIITAEFGISTIFNFQLFCWSFFQRRHFCVFQLLFKRVCCSAERSFHFVLFHEMMSPKISVLCLLAGVAGRSVALLTSAQNDYVAGQLKNAAFFCVALVTSLVKYAFDFFLQTTERKKT